VKVLVIDNYDSFTYNLVHLIADVFGEEPWIVRNDERSWDSLRALNPAAIVISPGPGHPNRDRDFGVSRNAIASGDIPLLGVCLGHQGIATFYGGLVEAAPQPIHGRTSLVRHDGSGLFDGIPSPLTVARYHSLAVKRPLPSSLRELAQSDDGVVMALAHRESPQWGVQFHPESIITEHGRRLLQNFRDEAHKVMQRREETVEFDRPRRAMWRVLPLAVDTEATFARLHGNEPDAFWLDSSLIQEGHARWSFFGDVRGPRSARIEYDGTSGRVTVDQHGVRRVESVDILAYLERERVAPPAEMPPVPFVGGYVGWFGYELRGLCGSPHPHRADTPDAMFFRVDRFVAVDHVAGRTYVVAIHEAADADATLKWVDDTVAILASDERATPVVQFYSATHIDFVLDRDRATYIRDVEQALKWIGEGESYQLCLTNQIRCRSTLDPLTLYRTLRKVNPAPYAAYLRWPGGAVMSASPERFLLADRHGALETKPIKGTCPREADSHRDKLLAERLRDSEKDRAENVMIVDLLRNDFSRVCEVGSVVVPSLYALESYATVHQLVSTVRGKLRSGTTLIDAVRASFPGGSMIGAPKLRSMELIDELEARPRGPYAGALGWLGDDGAGDLSIVIRAIVATPGMLTIGVGGGIVAQSTPDGEFAEMLLKGIASIHAIVQASMGAFGDDLYTIHGVEDPV
jgi:para-aminobenzoate synthetase